MAPGRRLNLILRGHVRSSFDDDGLRRLTREIQESFDLKVYVQTWNIVQNSLSWRSIPYIHSPVDEELVRKYLKGIRVEEVIVLDDLRISHVGETRGKVGRTLCPVLGWKNMYYGMLSAARRVLEREGPGGITAQMRLDVLCNSFVRPKGEIIDFMSRDWDVIESGSQPGERMRFLRMECFLGVDNISMARTEDMHRFTSYMYHDMDRILRVHRDTINQEHIAFHERRAFLDWDPPREPVGRSSAS